LTLRNNTERPVTIEEGTNTLLGNDILKLKKYLGEILSDTYKKGKPIEMWDGKASQRITNIIIGKVLKN